MRNNLKKYLLFGLMMALLCFTAQAAVPGGPGIYNFVKIGTYSIQFFDAQGQSVTAQSGIIIDEECTNNYYADVYSVEITSNEKTITQAVMRKNDPSTEAGGDENSGGEEESAVTQNPGADNEENTGNNGNSGTDEDADYTDPNAGSDGGDTADVKLEKQTIGNNRYKLPLDKMESGCKYCLLITIDNEEEPDPIRVATFSCYIPAQTPDPVTYSVDWSSVQVPLQAVYGASNGEILKQVAGEPQCTDSNGNMIAGTLEIEAPNTIQPAGNQTITLVFTPDAQYGSMEIEGTTKEYNVTVTKRPVTLSGIKIPTKLYDGNHTAPVILFDGMQATGILAGDLEQVEVNSENAAAAYESCNVGDNIKVTITGLELTGEKKDNYTLVVPEVYGAIKPIIVGNEGEITLSTESFPLTGSIQRPEITVKYQNTTLEPGKDYKPNWPEDCTLVGEKQITVQYMGNYQGAQTVTYWIVWIKDLTDEDITVDPIGSFAYTGSAIQPKVNVRFGDATLKEGTDYSITCANNINPGTATATITGMGSYRGTITRSFSITAAPLTGTVTIRSDPAEIHTGSVLSAVTDNLPQTTLVCQWYRGSTLLATGQSYTVTDADQNQTITLKVTAYGNCTGERSASVAVGKTVFSGTVSITRENNQLKAEVSGQGKESCEIQWLRDGLAIPGATGTAYTLTDGDLGHTISARAATTGSTYTGAAESNQIAIEPSTPEFMSVPTVTSRDGKAEIAWSVNEKGAQLLRFTLRITDTQDAQWTEEFSVSPSTRSYTIGNLTNGRTYEIRLICESEQGSTEAAAVTAMPQAASKPQPSEGGVSGGTTASEYSPAVRAGEHGSVDLSPAKAKPGELVTIRLTPEEGYKLGTLTVKDTAGNTVELQEQEDGTLSFVMPEHGATIEAEFVSAKPVFEDVPEDAYYAEAVAWAVERGITVGTGDTTFGPEEPCTRAQAVTFLWRAAGCPEPFSNYNPFMDLEKDGYYEKAVFWALQSGITQGTDERSFSPEDTIDRKQMITLMYRCAGDFDTEGKPAFADIPADAYYATSVEWAAANGITNGTGGAIPAFRPDDLCLRGQIVTFLYRYYGDQPAA